LKEKRFKRFRAQPVKAAILTAGSSDISRYSGNRPIKAIEPED
jgi:hypothetical protein